MYGCYSNMDLFSMYNLYEGNAIHQKCSLFLRISFNGRLLCRELIFHYLMPLQCMNPSRICGVIVYLSQRTRVLGADSCNFIDL